MRRYLSISDCDVSIFQANIVGNIFPKDRIYFFVDEAPTIGEMFEILHSNHPRIPNYYNWHREIHCTSRSANK